MRKFLGYCCLALPFAALPATMCMLIGCAATAAMFGGFTAVIGVLWLGVHLVEGKQ